MWEDGGSSPCLFFFLIGRGGKGERVGEKHQRVVASHVMAPTGDLACNPGMCPDWKLNWQPFGSQPALSSLSYTSRSFQSYKYLLTMSTHMTLWKGHIMVGGWVVNEEWFYRGWVVCFGQESESANSRTNSVISCVTLGT